MHRISTRRLVPAVTILGSLGVAAIRPPAARAWPRAPAALATPCVSTAPQISGWPATPGYRFMGRLADVAFYTGGLTVAQVAMHHAIATGQPTPPAPPSSTPTSTPTPSLTPTPAPRTH